MSNEFSISFGDLDYSRQQSLIDSVKTYEYEDMKAEGMEFLKRKEHSGRTWEEAFVREYCLGDLDEEAVYKDYVYEVSEEAERRATVRCQNGFRHLIVEI